MTTLRWYLFLAWWTLRHAVTPHRVGCAVFLARYGIAQSLVSRIRSGKAWAHIPVMGTPPSA